jgi:hypothetical protein
MESNEYITQIFNEKFGISANFAQASDSIFMLDADGQWFCSQYQVADFRHDSDEAMRRQIEEFIRNGGDDPADFADEINKAINNIHAPE